MRFDRKSRLFRGAALAALLISLPSMAHAQQAAPDDEAAASANDITITARRQSETLHDAPLTITAVSGESLKQFDARTLQDITFLTPGLTISPGTAEFGGAPVIRGLTSLGGSSAPTVGVFFDGAYIAGTAALSVALLDMERVEIVKGPVNSLYGRPAYAGAINYVSVTPTDRTEVLFDGMVGNDGQRRVHGVIGGAIVPGLLAVRLAGQYEGYNGGYVDKVNGLHAGDFDKRDIQLSVALTPSPDLNIVGRFYYGNDIFGPGMLGIGTNNCGPQVVYGPDVKQAYYCGEYDPKQNPVEVAPQAVKFRAQDRKLINSFLKASYDLDFMNIQSLTTYSKVTSARFTDFIGLRNGTPFNLDPGPGVIYLYENLGGDQDNKDFSEELRFSAKPTSRIRWTFGGYYSKTTYHDTTGIALDSDALPPGQSIRNSPGGAAYDYGKVFLTPGGKISDAVTESKNSTQLLSGFAGADVDLTDKLIVSGEGRYTSTKLMIDPIRSNLITRPGYRPFGGPFKVTNNNWNYRGSVQYKFTPDLNVYATVANGQKSGGFNITFSVLQDLYFAPEKNTTFEAGIKANLFDRMLSVNLSAFLINIKGLQRSGPNSDPSSAAFITRNTGDARSKGLELDFAATPMSGLKISGGAAFTISKVLDGSYDFQAVTTCRALGSDWCDQSRIELVPTPAVPAGLAAVNIGGYYLPYQSKWTANIQAAYTHEVFTDWEGTASIMYRYQSRQFGEIPNFYWTPPLHRVNAKVGITNKTLTFSVFADNLTNNKTPDRVYRSSTLNDFSNIYNAAMPFPRRYGLEIGFRY